MVYSPKTHKPPKETAMPKEGSGRKEPITKRGEELKEEMDALVDEIDEVLEENAEQFVQNYTQRGGE
tara:strand:- start:23561 stop:23761 length:201 start_codon:yes stop_codon:yes gene_type:complete